MEILQKSSFYIGNTNLLTYIPTKEEACKQKNLLKLLSQIIKKQYHKEIELTDYIKIGYKEDIGYYAIKETTKDNYYIIKGLPAKSLEKALTALLISHITQEEIQREQREKEVYKKEYQKRFHDNQEITFYDQRIIIYERIIKTVKNINHGKLPQELIQEYEKYLEYPYTYLEWKYNEATETFIPRIKGRNTQNKKTKKPCNYHRHVL